MRLNEARARLFGALVALHFARAYGLKDAGALKRMHQCLHAVINARAAHKPEVT